MSENLEFFEKPEFKEWLEDIRTIEFFKNIEESVFEKMEQTTNELFSLPMQASINVEHLKNIIVSCQAQINLINSYTNLKNNIVIKND